MSLSWTPLSRTGSRRGPSAEEGGARSVDLSDWGSRKGAPRAPAAGPALSPAAVSGRFC